MTYLPTVAIIGGTGNLGSHIVHAFLSSPLRPSFQDVVVLARSESAQTKNYASAGAVIRQYSEDNLLFSLENVQVLVNAIGPAGHHFKNFLLEVLPKSSVTLYFPSEFGVDHYIHDFPHAEWDAKRAHLALTQKLIPMIKVCRVFAGLFLEDSIGPWFGFYTAKGKYEAVGSLDQCTSYTSLDDVGRALAVLASMAPGDVPEQIHLSGDCKSVAEIAEIMQKEGLGEVELSTVDLQSYRSDVLAKPSPTPERYLRFLMGEGRIDHSKSGLGNDNDVFQAFAGFGKWKTMQALALETGGKPWTDQTWDG